MEGGEVDETGRAEIDRKLESNGHELNHGTERRVK